MKSKLLFTGAFVLMFLCNAKAQQRIITAGSAITETVCALGDCDLIIASDKTSLYPSQIQNLPSIGYRSSIHAEGILSLKPTMVIAEKDYVNATVLQQLEAAKIELIIIDRELNIEDTKRFIEEIAKALKRVKEARVLIEKIEHDIAEAASLLEGVNISPKVACIYNRGTATVTACGDDTFAGILQYAKAQNCFSNISGYKPLNTEAIISANPDFIVLTSTGYESLGGLQGVLGLPGIPHTKAGREKKIIVIDSLKLTNFGPRIGEAIKELAQQLHQQSTVKRQ